MINFFLHIFVNSVMRLVITKYFLLCVCCVMLTGGLFAQQKYSLADKAASSAKATSIEMLHAELSRQLNTDEEKLRAFYYWITHNINYDVNEWTRPSGNFAAQSAVNVLKNKKAVCHGYSELFKSLCDLSGIKCFLVSGYTKRENVFVNEGHTWNIVFVNNQWLPIDATWGAGGVNENGKYIMEFDENYFLPNPIDFLKDHYPFDPAWQLVHHPVSLSNYRKKDWIYKDNPGGSIYNFNDTISSWMLNDSTTMRVMSAKRMVRMNPEDPESKKELSYALMDFAQEESIKGTSILSELYPKSKNQQTTATKINLPKDEFNKKLDTAYRHFTTADSVLNKVVVLSQSDRVNVENTRKVLKHNMNVIKMERGY